MFVQYAQLKPLERTKPKSVYTRGSSVNDCSVHKLKQRATLLQVENCSLSPSNNTGRYLVERSNIFIFIWQSRVLCIAQRLFVSLHLRHVDLNLWRLQGWRFNERQVGVANQLSGKP